MSDYVNTTKNGLKKAALGLSLLFVPSLKNDYSPRFLQSRALLYIAVFLLFIRIITAGFYLPFNKNIFFADITKTDLVSLLNQSRQSVGLNALAESPQLDQAAMLKAQDMVANNYFAHQSPQGLTPWFWFLQVGYNYKYAGENLAIGFFDSKEAFNAWLDSPTHKANILNPHYKEVGTAVLAGFGGNKTIVVVQDFGSLKQASVAVNPVPKVEAPLPQSPPPVAPSPVPTITSIVQHPPATRDISVGQDKTEAPVTTATPQPVQKVLGSTTLQIVRNQSTNSAATNGWYLGFVNFMVYDYQKAILYIAYLLLLLVSVSLILNVFVNINVGRGQLILKSLLVICILSSVILLGRGNMGALFGHQVFI